MNRRRFLRLAVVAGILLLGVGVWFFGAREPVYQGRGLSAWVADLHPHVADARQHRAGIALRAIGTNALPYLLKLLQYREPLLKTELREWSWKTKEFLRMDTVYALPWVEVAEKRMHLINAFSALGPAARPAFPALTNLLLRADTAYVSAVALARIGPEALAPLTNALDSPLPEVRSAAAGSLGTIRVDPALLLPSLKTAAKDTDRSVRVSAVVSLGAIAANDPTAVVSELLNSLRDPNASVRLFAIGALSNLGEHAQTAVPELVRASRSLDRLVSGRAREALRKIAPETAASMDAQPPP